MNRSIALKKTASGLLFVLVIPIFWMISSSDLFKAKLPDKINDNWPPAIGKEYPDLTLIDQDGQEFNLSQLKGKTIVIEPIGMNCPACQSFSGAQKYGTYRGNSMQNGLPSFRDMFYQYAPALNDLDSNTVFIQLLLYDMKMGQPTKQDAKSWSQHFKLYKNNAHYVTISAIDLRNSKSFKLIPGFQLIDKDFILRYDSTGHNPKDNLYTKFIPALRAHAGNNKITTAP